MAELIIKPNKQILDYLKLYGEAFGYNAEWAAHRFITEGIHRSINDGMLEKAQRAFNLSNVQEGK